METYNRIFFGSESLQIFQAEDSFGHFPDHPLAGSPFKRELSWGLQEQSQNANSARKCTLPPIDETKGVSGTPESPRPLDEEEIKKLNTWKFDTKFGDFVEGTKILPCKVFLSEKKWTNVLESSEQFILPHLAEALHQKGSKIGVIIDINRSLDYYNFEQAQTECSLLSETKYIKFKLENAKVPNDEDVNDVYEVLRQAHEEGQVVVIHCFNGVNRTGYIISDFLCRYLGLSGEEAIRRFEKARNHKIAHKCISEKIKEKYPC